MLEIRLTHMNARLYDPVLARFISADPLVQAPHDLQSLNRYGYVFNNPLAYTDPSGYQSNLNEIKITEGRWINPLVTVNPLLGDTLAGGLSGGMSGPGRSPADFAQRFDNAPPAVQSPTPPSGPFIWRRGDVEPLEISDEDETPGEDGILSPGKAADLAGGLTPLGYFFDLYGALYSMPPFMGTPCDRLCICKLGV
ncbi:RHS repeat-associated core domain-containing protein [Nitrosovibrio sp. Nv17]|nr:RHS repeat-associated core domain-containing protein [Nitrosovibrio sp. Nv17]